MEQLNENELVVRLKGGDHLAYGQLFNRYWKMAFAIAHRKTGDEQEALDIVQNIFSHLWENREQLSISGSFAAWLTAVVRHKVIDWYRTSKTHDAHKAQLWQQLHAQQALEVTARDEIARRELERDWQLAVDSMPVRMKEVYLLSNQSLLPVSEIARKLSLKPQTVKNQLYRAGERLRKMLVHHFPLF